jgi:DNA-binding NtrC family response regulator
MGTVLIVDDEPAVRELMARWVGSLGLRSQTAASADEALETLKSAHCDLAVIDVHMPDRDGFWLASEIGREHPHTAVVIATGSTDVRGSLNSTASIADLSIADFLTKPFQRDRFALAVDRGRLWRKHVLEEVEWQARLSVELRDRAAQLCALMRQTSPAADAAATRHASRATRRRSATAWDWRPISSPPSAPPHDSTISEKWPCPTRS